jgi:hypothetical protein
VLTSIAEDRSLTLRSERFTAPHHGAFKLTSAIGLLSQLKTTELAVGQNRCNHFLILLIFDPSKPNPAIRPLWLKGKA